MSLDRQINADKGLFMSTQSNSIQRIRPPLAGWIGGKSLLARRIIADIPEHTCYCEVFVGAAWILFKKPESPVEIINDYSSDVANLYRVIRYHLNEFVAQFRWVLPSREEWQRQLNAEPSTLTDIQRAARFYYLQKLSFGGKVKGRTFGTATTHPPRINILGLEREVSDAHQRLANVMIENLDFEDCIKRYDREHTFFYLDPPYFGVEDYYGDDLFSRADFERLANVLKGIKGKFMLSINDKPEIRDLFNVFKIEVAEVTYSCGKGSRPKVGELLIKNY